ncbi:RNA methyltransferase [Patescibacteria group bacterium]|nr:RNA methyltransferase [Patescibacteria group bacterium]
MTTTTLLATENDVFQNIETLRRNREKRNALKQCFFEGVRNINNAIQYGWTIDAFLYTKDRRLSPWAEEILKTGKAKKHYELPLHLLKKLSEKEEPSELLAVAALPKDDLTRIPLSKNLFVVVFDRPASPGNLGTLLRSCDAFGVDGVIISGHAVDVYDPETIRAATGSLFALPIVRIESQKELLPWFEKIRRHNGDFQIIGTDEKGTASLSDCTFTRPTVLLVGNETRGLSAAYLALCDTLAKIPMQGSTSSLNVACATSIALYEMQRQRKLAK